jgi:hypothetical protein
MMRAEKRDRMAVAWEGARTLKPHEAPKIAVIPGKT